MLSFDLEPEQSAFAQSVNRFAADAVASGSSVLEAWPALAELGVLGLGTEHGGGAPLDLVVAVTALGRAAFGGPLVPTLLAVHCFEPETSEALASGTRIAGLAVGDQVAWGPVADVVLAYDEGQVWRAEAVGTLVPFRTMAGDPWGRGALELRDPVVDPAPALAVADLAVAAWILGAAQELLEVGAEHARNRHQFGRPIGDFQAVAHRLADSRAEVDAARDLTLAAASVMGSEGGHRRAAQARLVATRAALTTAYGVHQAMGAVAFASESGIHRYSTAIRQCSLLPPLGARAEHSFMT